MLIRRSSPVRNFTVLPNEFLQDERMSWTTRGILGEILSRPEGWQASADSMAKRASKIRGERVGEGRRAVRAAFAEAEKFGYIVRSKERIAAGAADAGQFVTILTFYDAPQATRQGTATGTSVPPAETAHKARSHQGTGDGTSMTGTSIERTDNKEPKSTKNRVSAVAETSSVDAVASSASHAVACSAQQTKSIKVPNQRRPAAATKQRADDPRSERVTYYETSRKPNDGSKLLYDAIDEMADAACLTQWAEFRRMRPSISKDCLRKAENQLVTENPTASEATIVNLALKYGVLHYEGHWPRFVVPESMRPRTVEANRDRAAA